MTLTANDLRALSHARHMVDAGELRRVRQRAALTQQEIAEVCGVTTSAVCLWEQGRTIPTSVNARSLAEIINVLEASN